jgi:GTPase SAR1 family protein
MAAKILINGPAGTGKTSLLRDLDDAFVVSRDGKAFPFKIPHMTIKEFYDMSTVILGGTIDIDGEEVYVEGVEDKLEKYAEKFGEYPKTVVIDSVSKLMQDAIDYANLNFEGFDVHSTINKEIAVLTSFVQETLVANGVNVVLINSMLKISLNQLSLKS